LRIEGTMFLQIELILLSPPVVLQMVCWTGISYEIWGLCIFFSSVNSGLLAMVRWVFTPLFLFLTDGGKVSPLREYIRGTC
jgi:hypothetical protein